MTKFTDKFKTFLENIFPQIKDETYNITLLTNRKEIRLNKEKYDDLKYQRKQLNDLMRGIKRLIKKLDTSKKIKEMEQ